jgi:hypothetical protein
MIRRASSLGIASHLAALLGCCLAVSPEDLRHLVADSDSLTEFVEVVCSVATQKERNLGRVTDALCRDIATELPEVELAPHCPAAVEAVWDAVMSMCSPSEQGVQKDPQEQIRTLCVHHDSVKISRAVSLICRDLETKPGITFRPSCVQDLTDVWRLMESKCPGATPPPAEAAGAGGQRKATDEEVKLICGETSWQQVRVRDITGVCQAIEKRIAEGLQITFEPDCQTYLDEIWDDALEECPHGKETMLLSVQSIEAVICKTATGQELQSPDKEGAIEHLCQTTMAERPYFKFYPDNTLQNCKTSMTGAWDIAKSKCPNGKMTIPSAQDFEKLICSFATKKQLDGNDFDGTCDKIKDSIEWIIFQPDCVTALRGVWHKAAEKCPLGSDKIPTPFEVEMLMCNAARRREMQDMRTIEICSEITLTTPWILRNFDPDCHSVFDVVWDDAVLKCPAGRDTIVNDHEFIYWACGHTLAEWIHHRSYDRICEQLLFEIPWLQNTVSPAQCPKKVSHHFEDMKRICPLGRATPLTRDRLIVHVCSFATAEQVAKHDTDHVCELMVARVPWLQFRASCHQEVEAAWSQIEEACPAGAFGPMKAQRRVLDESDILSLLPDGADGSMRKAPF